MKRLMFVRVIALVVLLGLVGLVASLPSRASAATNAAPATAGGLLTGHNPTFDTDIASWHYNASGWTWSDLNDGSHEGVTHFEYDNTTGAAIGFTDCSDQIYPNGSGNYISDWTNYHWEFDFYDKVNNQSAGTEDFKAKFVQYVSTDNPKPTQTIGTIDETDSNWHSRSKSVGVYDSTTSGGAVCWSVNVEPGDKVVINFDDAGLRLVHN